MFQLLYTSRTRRHFTQADLQELLGVCRANNLSLRVTGLLLYKDGAFMQALEGDEQTVCDLYEKIVLDPRHEDISSLLCEQSKERQFSDWSMAFYNLDDAKALKIPGYSEFLNEPLTSREFADNPTRCRELLLAFKNHLSRKRVGWWVRFRSWLGW